MFEFICIFNVKKKEIWDLLIFDKHTETGTLSDKSLGHLCCREPDVPKGKQEIQQYGVD